MRSRNFHQPVPRFLSLRSSHSRCSGARLSRSMGTHKSSRSVKSKILVLCFQVYGSESPGILNTEKAGSTPMAQISDGTTFFVICLIIFLGKSVSNLSLQSSFDTGRNGECCVELRGERPLYEVPLTEHAKVLNLR